MSNCTTCGHGAIQHRGELSRCLDCDCTGYLQPMSDCICGHPQVGHHLSSLHCQHGLGECACNMYQARDERVTPPTICNCGHARDEHPRDEHCKRPGCNCTSYLHDLRAGYCICGHARGAHQGDSYCQLGDCICKHYQTRGDRMTPLPEAPPMSNCTTCDHSDTLHRLIGRRPCMACNCTALTTPRITARVVVPTLNQITELLEPLAPSDRARVIAAVVAFYEGSTDA